MKSVTMPNFSYFASIIRQVSVWYREININSSRRLLIFNFNRSCLFKTLRYLKLKNSILKRAAIPSYIIHSAPHCCYVWYRTTPMSVTAGLASSYDNQTKCSWNVAKEQLHPQTDVKLQATNVNGPV